MTKPADFEYVGRLGGEPVDESEHFYRCKACGQAVDKRDLAQVFYHEAPGHRTIEGLAPTPHAVGRLH
ncbi:hypothetical protein LJR164_004488 [Phenylobacterium sp. LjRoot164]|uniref:hypothetical protein n=1 Tax=unclassified Phenylobacterium TaxID=2640670 RepID=UPI003ECEF31C